MSIEKGIRYNAETGLTEEYEFEITLPNPRILEIQNRISEIRVLLSKTDYKTTKYIEGSLSEEEFSVHKSEREELRAEYRSLEEELFLL